MRGLEWWFPRRPGRPWLECSGPGIAAGFVERFSAPARHAVAWWRSSLRSLLQMRPSLGPWRVLSWQCDQEGTCQRPSVCRKSVEPCGRGERMSGRRRRERGVGEEEGGGLTTRCQAVGQQVPGTCVVHGGEGRPAVCQVRELEQSCGLRLEALSLCCPLVLAREVVAGDSLVFDRQVLRVLSASGGAATWFRVIKSILCTACRIAVESVVEAGVAGVDVEMQGLILQRPANCCES